MKPHITDAPGITWRPRKVGWEARWQARSDLIAKGYRPRSLRIWSGVHPDELETDFIRSKCTILQNEMLQWAHGGITPPSSFDGRLASLIRAYHTDRDSPYRKLRYITKRHYDNLTARIDKEYGEELIGAIKARTLLAWHEKWSDMGKVSMGHSLIGMLRTLMTFGATILDSDECRKVKVLLHDMKFKMGKPRNERLTAEQASAIRAKAHELGKHSIALAQAFQFECMLRQKDVIGEWVPISEPGVSYITEANEKWMRGIRWEEIDANLVLRHITSKRQKEIEIDLKLAPMVMEEFERMGALPASGPIIVSERLGVPWGPISFRRAWRAIADECGIPASVRNMDTRAGAISEATDAGAELEHVRHAATHGDISMTQRYSRGAVQKIAKVQTLRSEYRNKQK